MTTETQQKTPELLSVTKDGNGGVNLHVGPDLEAAMIDLFNGSHLQKLNKERAERAAANNKGLTP